MTGTGGATTAELAPEPALRAWVGDRLPGEGPFTIRRATKGLSNEMFLLARSGHHWMLRRPPRTVTALSVDVPTSPDLRCCGPALRTATPTGAH